MVLVYMCIETVETFRLHNSTSKIGAAQNMNPNDKFFDWKNCTVLRGGVEKPFYGMRDLWLWKCVLPLQSVFSSLASPQSSSPSQVQERGTQFWKQFKGLLNLSKMKKTFGRFYRSITDSIFRVIFITMPPFIGLWPMPQTLYPLFTCVRAASSELVQGP